MSSDARRKLLLTGSYDELRSVFALAFDRCSKGKGRTHSSSDLFEDDDFWAIMSTMHGSQVLKESPELAMPVGQALKDIMEYMKSGSSIKLMDAAVYLALAYMVDSKTRPQVESLVGNDYDRVAQQAEQPASNPEDEGSSPSAVSSFRGLFDQLAAELRKGQRCQNCRCTDPVDKSATRNYIDGAGRQSPYDASRPRHK